MKILPSYIVFPLVCFSSIFEFIQTGDLPKCITIRIMKKIALNPH